MIPRLLPIAPLRATFALLFAVTLAAAPQAQVVFDDFTALNGDGNPANGFAFAGGAANSGAGFGPTTGQDGAENSAFSLGVNPGDGGGFAGGGTNGPEALVDISSTTYMTFYFNANTVAAGNTPLTLEINLQEDAAGDPGFQSAVDDEYQALYRVMPGAGWQLVAIPLAAFTDDNSAGVGSDDGFDFAKLATVAFAFGNLQGPEFNIQFDDILFWEDLDSIDATLDVVFDDFTALNGDGNPENAFAFAGGDGGPGAGFGPAEGEDGTENSALSFGVNPGTGGGFAGTGTNGPADAVDISGSTYMAFYFNPNTVVEGNTPMILEVNIQEDTSGDGNFDNAVDDEFQMLYTVTPGAGWQLVVLPLASFTDDNTAGVGSDDGFDFTKLATVVFAIGGLQGPEFNIQFDNIEFYSNAMVSTASEALPETFTVAPVVFPNPTAGDATVAFGLTSPSMVRAEVYDMLGRRVAMLTEGNEPAGEVRLAIPTEALVSGTYLIRIQTDAGAAMTRLTVTR